MIVLNILIFSDTHQNTKDPIDVIRSEAEVNAIIHTGDHEADAVLIHEEFPNIPIYYVPGNCDILTSNPKDLEFTLCGKRIFITHGDTYNVKYSLSSIMNKAAYGNYDLVVFGHTHKALIEYYSNSIIVNPGSVKGYPRTYAKATIKNNELKVSIEEFK